MEKQELTRKFEAVDETGHVYTISEFTDYGAPDSHGNRHTDEGSPRWTLEDGSAVSRVGNFYQVVSSGLILREIELPA